MELSSLQQGQGFLLASPPSAPPICSLVCPRSAANIPISGVHRRGPHGQAGASFNRGHGRGFLNLPLGNKDIPYLKVIEEEIFLAAPADHPIFLAAHGDPSDGHAWIDFETMNGQNSCSTTSITGSAACSPTRFFADSSPT